MLDARVLADGKGETSGVRARHLATICKRKADKTEAKDQKWQSHKIQRCIHLFASNSCSFSLEKQKLPHHVKFRLWRRMHHLA